MFHTLACLSSLLLTAPSGAQPPFDAGPRTKLIAPLLNEQTYAVVRVDLARLDEEGIVKAIVPLIPENLRDDFQDALQAVKRYQTVFTKAGRTEFIVVFDTEEMTRPSYVYVPLSDKTDIEALAKSLQETIKLGRNTEVMKFGNYLVVSSASGIKRLKTRKEPVAREGLVDAVKAAGDTGVQVLLLPTKDQRRVIEEVMPNLPKELGGTPSKHLTRGLRWASCGIDVAPKPAVKLTLQCADANAATTINALMVAGMQMLGEIRFPGEDKPFRGLYPAEHDLIIKALRPEVKDDRLVVAVSDPGAILAAIVKAESLLSRFGRTHDAEKLRQLAIALHNYHDPHGGFPANAIYSKDGKPLLSWRVAILPYLEQDNLYKQFKLDEPWDSAHNKQLIEKMPEVFRSSRMKLKRAGMTTFLAPIGESLMFTGTNTNIKINDVTDGTSNTILFVDAADDQAVVWTKPDDLKVDPNAPFKGLIGHYPSTFLTVFADGTTHAIPKNYPPKMLWYMFSRNDGQVVQFPDD